MKKNICLDNKCIKCCIKTSMLLTENDINKIKNLGYKKEFFVKKIINTQKLKNKDGKCVFHNGKICQIYENRPEGCKIYPLIFDVDLKSAVVDRECSYGDNFKFSTKDVKKLYNILSHLNIDL